VPRLLLVLAFAVAQAAAFAADVLVFRNGTRIEGALIAVRGGVVEFEERRGYGRGRTLRVDRAEVARIEFDDLPPDDIVDRGRPRGLRERQVAVLANIPWNDTGVDVRAGQTVYFEASGSVRWGRDRRDGPRGESGSPSNPGRPLPNRPAAALIGRIGNVPSDSFFIGDDAGPIRMRANGRLYLGINDDFLADNTGSFRVVVYY
jgi:hypothetical protein